MRQADRTASLWTLAVAIGLVPFFVRAEQGTVQPSKPKQTEHTFEAPDALKMTVRMIAPYAAPADLQIVCVFRHNSSGDKYIEAFKDFDDKLLGLLSSLRNRGDFVGELGETICFKTWPDSITPKRVLIIGLGAEKDLSLDSLRLVGRVAVREAVRLRAADVAFAPVIRDQGNSTIDVGEGDRTFAEQFISAYHTEKQLQAEGLAEPFTIRECVIEAGPAYIDGAIEKVGKGVEAISADIRVRPRDPYRRNKK